MYKGLPFILLLSITAPASQAGEMEERSENNERFSALFMQEKFSDLDKQAQEYRANLTRSSSGIFALTHFYRGLSTAREKNEDEKYWEEIESAARKFTSYYPGILSQLSLSIARAEKNKARVSYKGWAPLKAKALKWAEQSPDSAAARNAYADLLIEEGWSIRGHGWSHEVRSEDWKPFGEKMAQAREYLLKNKHIASRDPEWYSLMLIIAKGEHWDRKEYDKLVEEAVSRYPYYYPIYFSALEYLLPKWHGSDDEVIRFIESTVERTKKSEGQVMYARMYWYAIDNVTDSSPYVRSPVIWAKIRSGMDEVLARYPDQWNINNFAKFACYAVDKEKGKELFNRIEGEPILSVWGDINYYTIWKNMMTGSQDPVDINQFGKIGQI